MKCTIRLIAKDDTASVVIEARLDWPYAWRKDYRLWLNRIQDDLYGVLRSRYHVAEIKVKK